MLPHTIGALRQRAPERAGRLDDAAGDARRALARRLARARRRRAPARPRGRPRTRWRTAPTPPRSAPQLTLTPPPPTRTSCGAVSAPRTTAACVATVLDLLHRPHGARPTAAAPTPRRATSTRATRPRASATGASTTRDARRSTGIGVRVRVGGGWGFAATRDVTRGGRRGRARRGRSRSPRRSPPAPARPLAPVDARARALGLAVRARPVRACRSRTSSACCSPPRPRCARATRGSSAPWPSAGARARAQGVRHDRGRGLHPGASSSCGGGLTASRPTAASCRCAPTRSPTAATSRAAGLGARARARPRGRTRRASPRRPSRCSRAPVCPRAPGPSSSHGEQLALQVHESDRPRARARPHPPRRGLLRRDELGQPAPGRTRRRGAALRLRAAHDHRRRDAARRPGDLRLGRRGRRRRAGRPSSTPAPCAPR